jgi:hypothetical protein
MFESSIRLRPLLALPEHRTDGGTADESCLSRPGVPVGKVGKGAATIWLTRDFVDQARKPCIVRYAIERGREKSYTLSERPIKVRRKARNTL